MTVLVERPVANQRRERGLSSRSKRDQRDKWIEVLGG